MCSVSFVPLEGGFLLTSNRDEKSYRPTIEPKIYFENGVELIYPKDKKAGGTWIVAKEDGTCIVLLNGAFENHQKKDFYTKSRGVVLKEIIVDEEPVFYFSEVNLKQVEPFTLIIFQKNELTEVRWDGVGKYITPKSIDKPHFWSSATLYNQSQQDIRKQWFQDFCYKKSLTVGNMLSFHSDTHSENTEFGLAINREDKTQTVSITQLVLNNNKVEMTYIDRITNKIIENITF
ncbi:transport and Golgi organization protein 2 [Mariniflexile fucanivorans]|uniref:Transport and Golgi organization protein 2 n=1 Tax=Mariniflexile fucanivorans TaxID=264023 RepID=A0A4R1RF51_9FLAO|nr:NRDE family protein [Mariniflexile fucanivorans]TCL64578.1 transport and Golgi organization protein 2 [Mariniflexile fucanivorans]